MKYGELPAVTLDDGISVNGILIKIRNPPKTAVLRLPTTEEMLARMGKTKVVRSSRGSIEDSDSSADVSLFEALRLDKGPSFDEAEIERALAKISFVQVTDCEANDSEYRISLSTSFGDAVIVLNDPTMADLAQCRRKWVVTRTLGRGKTETRYPPEPAIALYDKMVQSVEGYADSFAKENVPPDHKYAVIVALINKLDEIDLECDPNS